MKIAIMQPYFYPYIGYFQLMNVADVFVVYDDIQYVKQSWINRNRILINSEPSYISVPLKKDSDYLDVRERSLAPTWEKDRSKLIQRLKGAYSKAPYFKEVFEVLTRAIMSDESNLFKFLFANLLAVKDHLNIATKLVVSSELGDFKSLQSQDKVMAICKELGASQYINPIGGVDLYDKIDFSQNGMELCFLKSRPFEYAQYGGAFQAWLSIIDVMMFCGEDKTSDLINSEFCLC